MQLPDDNDRFALAAGRQVERLENTGLGKGFKGSQGWKSRVFRGVALKSRQSVDPTVDDWPNGQEGFLCFRRSTASAGVTQNLIAT